MEIGRGEDLVRDELVEVCRLMYTRGYIAGVEGNCSIRLGKNEILTTPRGACKGRIDKNDLVLVDFQGNGSESAMASTEIKMHIAAYNMRNDIAAVVHAHPRGALACSIAGIDLPDGVLPEVVCTLGKIPTAPYATPSTDEVAESIVPLAKEHDAIILDHHGVLCFGKTIWDAFYKLETVEHYAQTIILAKLLGGVQTLPQAQVEKLIGLRAFYANAMAPAES